MRNFRLRNDQLRLYGNRIIPVILSVRKNEYSFLYPCDMHIFDDITSNRDSTAVPRRISNNLQIWISDRRHSLSYSDTLHSDCIKYCVTITFFICRDFVEIVETGIDAITTGYYNDTGTISRSSCKFIQEKSTDIRSHIS